MPKRTGLAPLLLLLTASAAASAEDFDRRLLAGRWVDVFGTTAARCSDALLFEHELSADGSQLTLRMIRTGPLLRPGTPRVVEEVQAVLKSRRDSLFLRRDSSAGGSREWELRVLGDGRYEMRGEGLQTDAGDYLSRQRCR